MLAQPGEDGEDYAHHHLSQKLTACILGLSPPLPEI